MARPGAVILVVEDEPLLRLDAIDLVESAGFEAVAAANAAEAVTILKRRDDVRVVFTDIDMPPGMNGLELAAEIVKRWPPINVVMVSGNYAEAQIETRAGVKFFSKPYHEEDVVAALKAAAA